LKIEIEKLFVLIIFVFVFFSREKKNSFQKLIFPFWREKGNHCGKKQFISLRAFETQTALASNALIYPRLKQQSQLKSQKQPLLGHSADHCVKAILFNLH
jgi:hypothetical protein